MDTHFPHLTVKQTLDFAIASRTPRLRLNNISRTEYINYVRKLLLTVFGLSHTENTKVGNDYVRGVSGGERKRVSLSEALAAQASVYCWDNATRGLDASTALEYTQIIRACTNIMGNVGIVAIYQAGENIYNLFDKVTVFYAGRQVYFGPVSDGTAYFERMGWHRPPRQTPAEFLTAVTDPNGRKPRLGVDHSTLPKTADEFEAYWHASPEYQNMLAQIVEYNNSKLAEQTLDQFYAVTKGDKMKHQRNKSRYMLTYFSQLRLSIKRGFQRVIGDKTFTMVNIIAAICQALIQGSLFYHMAQSTSAAFSRGGLLFFSMFYNVISSLGEVTNAFISRPILMKQRSYSFYHPSVEALQYLISEFPFKMIQLFCFGIIIYFLSDLNRTAGQFFFFMFNMVLFCFCIIAYFKFIASWNTISSKAQAIAGLSVLVIAMYSGYMIPLPAMRRWFWWISFLNPLRYSFEAIMANEFHHQELICDLFVPCGPGYEGVSIDNQVCAFAGSITGNPNVIGDDYINVAFTYKWSHAWRNVGLVIVFMTGFVVLGTIGTEIIRPVKGGGDVLLFRRGHMPTDFTEIVVTDSHVVKTKLTRLQDTENPDIFSWQNVNYTISLSDGSHRKLLNNVQGYVKPGTLTALMGESGAGKTTLLNALSQRLNVGVITGDMFVNGKPLDDSFKRQTGYVQQQDLHLAESTVREALQFAALLRQPADVPEPVKLEYVEKIIELLDMTNYAEAFIGRVGTGLNVEQRKKLSIGVELVAKPSLLLFLDEPTSGLDSQSAWAIVSFMRKLAEVGQSILCTIHQPSATLFEEFDRLLLLKKGGQTVYFGEIGRNSETLVKYFERNGARHCKPSENPAEYILESIGAGATATVKDDWGQIWENSPEYFAVTREISELQEALRARPTKPISEYMKRKFSVPFTTQLKYVYQRSAKQYWRSPDYLMSKVSLMIIGGLFIGFSFYRINFSIAGLQNALFGVFLILVISAPLMNHIQEFAEQGRDLFEAREAASNTFHWAALLLSQFLCELPYHLVFSTLLFCCFYFPVHYYTTPSVAGYFYFVYCILFQLYYTSFALAIGYVAPNPPSAAVITALFFSFMIAFCGILQPVTNMVQFWLFMYRASPYTYFVQSLLGVSLHNRPVQCAPKEYNIFQPPSGQTCNEFAGAFVRRVGGYLLEPNATSDCHYCRYRVGDEYLSTVEVNISQKWRNVGIICGYILFNIFALLSLYYLFRVKSWNIKNPHLWSKLFKKSPKQPTPASTPSSDEGETIIGRTESVSRVTKNDQLEISAALEKKR